MGTPTDGQFSSSLPQDVINKCLSETQKLHIGAATDDPTAAGELKDGGVGGPRSGPRVETVAQLVAQLASAR
jgi:hypothetical protein